MGNATVQIYMYGLLYCRYLHERPSYCTVEFKYWSIAGFHLIETDRKLKETGQQIENILIFFKT